MSEISIEDRITAVKIVLSPLQQRFNVDERRAVLKVILQEHPNISNTQLSGLLQVSEGQVRKDRKAISAPPPPRQYNAVTKKLQRRKKRYSDPLLRALRGVA